MDPTPDLFDRTALSARRRRVQSQDALFLHKVAASEVSERIKDVNRTFTNAVFVGWQAALWSAETGVEGRCVPDDDVLDLEPESHDLIVHCLCLHAANDPVG